MRTLSTLLLLTITLLSFGQDWALINPAYRYNYSDDGTDTISNQIRVMEVDTLGVDSFLYTLNRIAFLCDTCPASLGGLCDGCFMWVDQPQFLRGSALHTPGRWNLMDPDTLLLLVPPVLGQSWVADPTGTVTATVVALEEDTYLGELDSIATIATSAGDTLVLSRLYGLIRMVRSDGSRYEGIGVEGPGLGEQFPDITDWFNYQSGDVLEYYHQMNIPEDGHYRLYFWKTKDIFEERIDSESGYTITSTRGHIFPSNPSWEALPSQTILHTLDYGVWSTPMNYFFEHIDLNLYPSKLSEIQMTGTYFVPRLVRNDDGLLIITTDSIDSPIGIVNAISYPGENIDQLWPLNGERELLKCQENIGLMLQGHNSNFEFSYSSELIGAVIQGDTIGTLTPDEVYFNTLSVSTNSVQRSLHILNTLCDTELMVITDPDVQLEWTIIDLNGRRVSTGMLAHTLNQVEVGSLATGTYVFMAHNAQGQWSQRFVVAR